MNGISGQSISGTNPFVQGITSYAHVLWATTCIFQMLKPSLNKCFNWQQMQGFAEKRDLQIEALDSVVAGIHWPSSLAYKGSLEGPYASVTCLWAALRIKHKKEAFTQTEQMPNYGTPKQMCKLPGGHL